MIRFELVPLRLIPTVIFNTKWKSLIVAIRILAGDNVLQAMVANVSGTQNRMSQFMDKRNCSVYGSLDILAGLFVLSKDSPTHSFIPIDRIMISFPALLNRWSFTVVVRDIRLLDRIRIVRRACLIPKGLPRWRRSHLLQRRFEVILEIRIGPFGRLRSQQPARVNGHQRVVVAI